MPSFLELVDSADPALFPMQSKAPGPQGQLPITAEMLLNSPSGNMFAWSQNAGMGWDPAKMGGKEILILSTHGGIRRPDGTAVALGYHTGHWDWIAPWGYTWVDDSNWGYAPFHYGRWVTIGGRWGWRRAIAFGSPSPA